MLPLLPLLTLAASFSLVSAADFPKLGKRRGDHHQNSKRYTTLTGQYQQEVLSSKYTVSLVSSLRIRAEGRNRGPLRENDVGDSWADLFSLPFLACLSAVKQPLGHV